MNAALKRWGRALCAAAILSAAIPHAIAQPANVCDAASPTNPDGQPAGAGGMGGTGINAGAGGMGGTGTMADVVPIVPGAGGMGGTGIVGTITGFASICVNGVEVHYDNRTPVAVNGKPGAPRDLAVGQIVAVSAREVAGRLQADGIGVIDAISGPVTRINAATRELQVMGQTVRADTASGADLSTLRVGTMARVAGHRAANGDVIATRVDTTPAGTASLHGTVTRVEADAMVVNGTRVTLGGRGTRGITAGAEVFAAGEWSGGALRAQRVDLQPVRNAIARAERAVIEGYVRGKTTRELNVGGVSVRLDDRVRYNRGNDRDAAIGVKVQVEVRRSGNEWQAERVILQREERNTRSRDVQQGGGRSGDDQRGGRDAGRSGEDRSDARDSGSHGGDADRSGGSGSSGSRDGGSRDAGTSGRGSGSNSGSGSRSGSGSGGRR